MKTKTKNRNKKAPTQTHIPLPPDSIAAHIENSLTPGLLFDGGFLKSEKRRGKWITLVSVEARVEEVKSFFAEAQDRLSLLEDYLQDHSDTIEAFELGTYSEPLATKLAESLSDLDEGIAELDSVDDDLLITEEMPDDSED